MSRVSSNKSNWQEHCSYYNEFCDRDTQMSLDIRIGFTTTWAVIGQHVNNTYVVAVTWSQNNQHIDKPRVLQYTCLLWGQSKYQQNRELHKTWPSRYLNANKIHCVMTISATMIPRMSIEMRKKPLAANTLQFQSLFSKIFISELRNTPSDEEIYLNLTDLSSHSSRSILCHFGLPGLDVRNSQLIQKV